MLLWVRVVERVRLGIPLCHFVNAFLSDTTKTTVVKWSQLEKYILRKSKTQLKHEVYFLILAQAH